MQRCVQTNSHNALTRVIQIVCTHRRSYETTSFEKECQQHLYTLNVALLSLHLHARTALLVVFFRTLWLVSVEAY